MAASVICEHAKLLKALPEATSIRVELSAIADVKMPGPRKVDPDLIHYGSGTRTHHNDAIREEDRFIYAVGDENRRLAIFQPQFLQIQVHLISGHRVQRAKRLV